MLPGPRTTEFRDSRLARGPLYLNIQRSRILFGREGVQGMGRSGALGQARHVILLTENILLFLYHDTIKKPMYHNDPSPFKTSPDIWLLDGSGDQVNLKSFPMT